jgi:hypothetical protein
VIVLETDKTISVPLAAGKSKFRLYWRGILFAMPSKSASKWGGLVGSKSLQRAFLAISGIAAIILFCIVSASVASHQHNTDSSWAGVEQALGTKGTLLPDGVFMAELPRDDLQVSIGDVALARPMALHSFVAFMDMGQQGSIVMGDLVLQPQELHVVQSNLLSGGLDITAIHNTLVGETPQVYDVHFEGKGDPVKIAGAVRAALESAKVPYRISKFWQSDSIPGTFDIHSIDAVMGVKGTYEDGVVHYSMPRAEKIMENGMEIPQSMDVATSIKLQPLPDNKVAVAGEYVLLADEVQPVMRALNYNGITVTATHTHMLTEEPRLFYLHVWAVGDPVAVARGLRDAIDQTNVKMAPMEGPVKSD